jgi:hypothetical protein
MGDGIGPAEDHRSRIDNNWTRAYRVRNRGWRCNCSLGFFIPPIGIHCDVS